MKRLLSLFLFIAVLAGLWYLSTLNLIKRGEDLDFLPNNTVALIQWRDPATTITDWRGSRLGRRLNAMDWPKALVELGADEEQALQFQHNLDELRRQLDSPLFRELFGQEVSLALLPPEDGLDLQAGDPVQLLADTLLLVCRPRHQTALLEFLTSVLAWDLTVTDQVFGEHEIKRYAVEGGGTFHTTATGDLLLVGLGSGVLKRALAQRDLKGPGLRDQARFQRLRGEFEPRREQFAFVNLEAAAALVEELAPLLPPPLAEPLLQARADWRGLLALGMKRRVEGELLRYDSDLLFDAAAMPAGRAALLQRPPVKNRTLAMFGPDPLVYSWSNRFDPLIWWQGIEARGATALSERVRATARRLGGEVEDLAPLFGQEFGLVVKAIKKNLFLPLPELCLFIEVRDREGVERLLDAALAEFSLAATRTKSGAMEIGTVKLVGGMIEPAFAQVNGFLVITDSREQLLGLVEQGRTASLLDDPAFKRVNDGLDKAGNTAALIRVAELLEASKGLARIAANFLGSGQRNVPVLVEEILLPLLDGLQMYQVQAIRGYTDQDRLVLETTLLVEPNLSDDLRHAGTTR